MVFPIEIINHILSFRPRHPVSNIMSAEIVKWKYLQTFYGDNYEWKILRNKTDTFYGYFFNS